MDSVRSAVGPSDEIILVDDGSTDGAKFLDGLGCTVIHKRNGGLSDARNAGVNVASGKYVTFVDSDDEVVPESFDTCIEQLEKNSSDICIYGVRTVWLNDGLQKVDSCCEHAYGRLTASDVYDLSRRCLMNYAWNKVYRSEFLCEHGIVFDVDGIPCEDIIYNIRCVMAGAKWCSADFTGYVYYRTRGTLLSKYKRTCCIGIQHGAAAWREFLGSCGEIQDDEVNGWLHAKCMFNDERLALIEWKNIWMPASPYSMIGRWKWLREHPSVGGGMAYLKMLLYTFLRRHFYWRPVRRWNIRRMYPYATEWKA